MDRRVCEVVAEGGLVGLVFASGVGFNVIFGNSDLLCDDGKDLFSSVKKAGKLLINDFRCAYHFALAVRLCRLCAGLCIDMTRLERLHQKRPYRRLPSCVLTMM